MEPEDIPTRKGKQEVFKNEKEKKIAENKEFIPLAKPKHTIEIAEKPKLTLDQIEIIEKKPEEKPEKIILEKPQGQKFKKAKTKIKSRKKEEKPEKIKTIKIKRFEKLSGNSILIITEKPQAASKIAAALSQGRARIVSGGQGVSFYEFEKNSQNIIVACAVGHLFSLSQNIKSSDYPLFDISWKPNFEVRKKDFTRKYYSLLAKLINRAKEIILACDYDTEGEVIGYNIIRFIAGQKDAKRMKFSSLTANEIEDSYKNVSLNINWGQAIAGETRHYLDWFYGINLSRALMKSIKSAGRFRIMSIGRVQGPALNLIVQKERQIQAFKPETFWRIFLDIVDKEDKTNKLRVRYIKDVTNKKDLKKFDGIKGKEASVETKKSLQKIPPLPPFDLTTLQTEAYKFFYLTPAKTLQIAQQLYLSGLISYPRTSSQKIPAAINPKNILRRLAEKFPQVKLASRDKPVEGHKSDPAHPSIYPTGEIQELTGDEKKIYELIVKRFISCFCEDAEVENKIITAAINGLLFKARGLEIKKTGWMSVYNVKLDEKELKDMNGKAIIEEVIIEEDQTKPPRRYSPASIITELEKRSLGTKATRAAIVETLYERNYILDNKSIKATPLGISLVENLEKYSPIIIDEKLTRQMEKDTEQMQTIKKLEQLKEKQNVVLEEAKKNLNKISSDFKKNEIKIGKGLVSAGEEFWKQQAKENEIAICPNCKKGMLSIKYSPKNKKYFIACNAYPNCKTTFSLPPYGLIKKLENKICEKCGFPLLMSLRKGKKPWVFCFNPNCESRKQKEENNNLDNNENNDLDNSTNNN